MQVFPLRKRSSAVRPRSSVLAILAPAPRSKLMKSARPFCAATWSGVRPSSGWAQFGMAPSASSSSNVAILPRATAPYNRLDRHSCRSKLVCSSGGGDGSRNRCGARDMDGLEVVLRVRVSSVEKLLLASRPRDFPAKWAFLAAAGHHLNDVPVRFTTLRTTKQAWKIHENTTTGVSPRRGATSRHSTPEQLTCATSAALPLPPTSSVLPHLEVAVLAARGDVAAVGAPVDRVDLVGVAGQLLLELAGLHRPHLDRRVLGAAREQSAVA